MKRKIVAIMLSASMIAGLLAGCGNTDTSKNEENTTQTEATQDEADATRTVTDSDGNEVEIPENVTAVAPAIGAFAEVTEMLLNGQGKVVAAATQQISDDFKEVFKDYTESNPNNYDSSSVEDLIASGAQVVYGPKSMYTDEQLEQMEKAGIAFVSVSNLSDSASMMDSFKLIGEILGEDEAARAEKFCDYYQDSIDDCQSRTKDLDENSKKKVLRLSVDGGTYSTVNKTDIFNSITEEAGGVNVAADYEVAENGNAGNKGGQGQNGNGGQGKKGGGKAGLTVDAEQILEWNPDVILTLTQDSVDEIKNDPALADVTAVKNGDVYNTPQGLYLWGVRSGENAMMTPWLGQVLYPDLFEDVDMKEIVKDFYADWYNTKLDDAGAEAVLAGK